MKIIRMCSVVAALGITGVIGSTACSSEDPTAEVEDSGWVRLGLSATSASGSSYRLRTAVFNVTGPQNATIDSEADLGASSVQLGLPEGSYEILLADGWSLERLEAGTFVPVDAVLLSNNPIAFDIVDQAVTPVAFRFRAGDETVDLGDGTLDLSIEVEDDGGALCSAPLSDCAGTCVDLSTDPNHCGACGSSCGANEACVAGACILSCSAGLVDCGGSCVDPSADPSNCGACGAPCGANETCEAGVCTPNCAAGLIECGGTCVDPLTNPNHCGGCGNSCTFGLCFNGVCF